MIEEQYEQRRMLLISNSSTNYGVAPFLDFCDYSVKSFLDRYAASRVLFISYAVLNNLEETNSQARVAFKRMKKEMDDINDFEDPVQAVVLAEAIFVVGGNTFVLLKKLYDNGLINIIRERVLQFGVPYIGVSAGAIVATANICTTNVMPLVHPPSFDAMRLVPFTLNPHYIDSDERDSKLLEYLNMPSSVPVLGLKDGCLVKIRGDKQTLYGKSGARIFCRDKKPKHFCDEDDISFLLKKPNSIEDLHN